MGGVPRLGKDTPTAGYHRIGGKDETALMTGVDDPGLFTGQSQGMVGWFFVAQGRFINMWGVHLVGVDADSFK